MIFFSSEQVFNGNSQRGPYREEGIPKPNTVYGENKLKAEELIKEVLDEVLIFRLNWLFTLPEKGYKTGSNILSSVLESIEKNEKIYASSHEFRGMTYIYELLEKFKSLLNLPFGTYHLGSENNLSRYEIVKHILLKLDLGDRIEEILVEEEKYKKENPRDLRLDTKKLKSFGISFLTTKESLSKMIKEEIANKR